MAMSRLRGASSVTSSLPIEIVPSVTSSRPAIIRSSVVLPQPEGPTKTMNSPSSISSSTRSTATTPPEKCFETCSRQMPATVSYQYQILVIGSTVVLTNSGFGTTLPPMAAERLEELVTESRSDDAGKRDLESTLELVRRMNDEDSTVADVVGRAAPVLARVIDGVVEHLARGGRLVYVGAGTSGRLAALDAEECESTFSAAPGQVVALVAGARLSSSADRDAAEDDEEAGRREIRDLGVSDADAVVAMSAS